MFAIFRQLWGKTKNRFLLLRHTMSFQESLPEDPLISVPVPPPPPPPPALQTLEFTGDNSVVPMPSADVAVALATAPVLPAAPLAALPPVQMLAARSPLALPKMSSANAHGGPPPFARPTAATPPIQIRVPVAAAGTRPQQGNIGNANPAQMVPFYLRVNNAAMPQPKARNVPIRRATPTSIAPPTSPLPFFSTLLQRFSLPTEWKNRTTEDPQGIGKEKFTFGKYTFHFGAGQNCLFVIFF